MVNCQVVVRSPSLVKPSHPACIEFRVSSRRGRKKEAQDKQIKLRLGHFECAVSFASSLRVDISHSLSALSGSTVQLCCDSRGTIETTRLERVTQASNPQPTTAPGLRLRLREVLVRPNTDYSRLSPPTPPPSHTPQWRNHFPQKSRRSSAISCSTPRASSTKKASRLPTRSCANTPTMAIPRP